MMLDPEEVDEDYFTPVASTSLASIFGNKSQNENVENESLKYIPPKQNTTMAKIAENKVSQCIFVCALLVYEWSQNTYMPKGKLGFAIMNILKNNSKNIILYDSNKTTISCTVITPKLEVTINEQNYLSYYDSNQRYWSIYATEDETTKIIDLLKSFGVSIKHSSQTDKGPPEPVKPEIPKILNLKETDNKDFGSDTDSSLNRKTKASLLHRMATMGQSVLPPRTNVKIKTSDSSDSNDSYEQPKPRHKPVKSLIKKNSLDRTLSHEHNVVEDQHKRAILPMPELSHENKPLLYTYLNGQLAPVTNTNIITNANSRVTNELDYFITEQRVSSSELRINMNRITDKVDNILEKVSSISKVDKGHIGSDFHNEILQKLLKEYEEKIKRYEGMLSSQTSSTPLDTVDTCKDTIHETEIIQLKQKIDSLEAIHKIKSDEILKLQEEITNLKCEHNDEIKRKQDQENEMLKQIKHLEENELSKNEKILTLEQQEQSSFSSSSEVSDKIKKIMNETYRAVSANFETDEMYSGEHVKNVMALIIKKITMDSLNEL